MFFTSAFSVPNPVIALSGFKRWTRKAFYEKIDLCTQPCYSQILPGLFLSNARAAGDRKLLRRLNITHVLTIETHRLPKSTFVNTNITTLFIRAYDTPQTNLMPFFPMANAFIDEGLQAGNVLVHCHFGVSRSATLVIAYIMEKYKLDYEQAHECVRVRRPFINPNAGFVAQLKEYHKLNYEVDGYHRGWAYVAVKARQHKYRIASVAAVVAGIMVPVVLLILIQVPVH